MLYKWYLKEQRLANGKEPVLVAGQEVVPKKDDFAVVYHLLYKIKLTTITSTVESKAGTPVNMLINKAPQHVTYGKRLLKNYIKKKDLIGNK
jgi:hypothetical protein